MTTPLQIATEVVPLCESKASAYGNSVDKSARCLAILYPDGLRPEQIFEAVIAARVIDKLSRKAQGNDPHGESPYVDGIGYLILGIQEEEKQGCRTNAPAWAVPKPPKERTASVRRVAAKPPTSANSSRSGNASSPAKSAVRRADSNTRKQNR